LVNVIQTLWATSIHPEAVKGEEYIPTALYYGEDVLIGSEALDQATTQIINDNFKVDLGDVKPGSTSAGGRRRFLCGDDKERTAFEMTQDYVNTLLGEIEKDLPEIEGESYRIPARILVAEPLSFQVEGRDKDWLANYRSNLRRILNRYDSVEFLPEPFAVYQYYRYGLRVPSLVERKKHIALILDYGGGTFDACVIESTHDGDVSSTLRHSKPLAADSIPCGGFYLNRKIALYLLKRGLDGLQRKKADQEFSKYERVLRGELDSTKLNPASQHFITNLKRLERLCETYKIELSSRIASWELQGECYDRIDIKIPKDPFSDGIWIASEFFGHQLRDVFQHEIWISSLAPVIKRVLGRAALELDGKEIGITLVSGGSANIGWLRELLIADFSVHLQHADPVNVHHSFQEIVANGLAIECARRFYSDESEFVAVTYNPIKLVLGTENDQLLPGLNFRSEHDNIDMRDAKPGDLVPSAQALRHFFDKPLHWKVNLPHAPKRKLEYLFTRPIDPSAQEEMGVDAYYQNAYNVEQTSLPTHNGKDFDRRTVVEVTVSKDGTVRPKFIYKSPNQERGISENSEVATPFYIDMTTDSSVTKKMSNYLGFDFGTSNSSICCLNTDQINVTHSREGSSSWQGISEASHNLPFPVAVAIRNFLNPHNSERQAEFARTLYEACLSLLSYTLTSEASLKTDFLGSIQQYQHRAMGPLRGLLELSASSLRWQSEYLGDLGVIKRNIEEIDRAITELNDIKHDKLSIQDCNVHEHAELIVKITADLFKGAFFGYCSTCDKQPLISEYRGTFVVAHDLEPFATHFPYLANQPTDSSMAMIISRSTGRVLSVTPFFFFWLDPSRPTMRSCFMLDNFKNKEGLATVKPCHESSVSYAGDLSVAVDQLIKNLYMNGQVIAEGTEIGIDRAVMSDPI
jgi:molecular chaperone DnaK (HSP70)